MRAEEWLVHRHWILTPPCGAMFRISFPFSALFLRRRVDGVLYVLEERQRWLSTLFLAFAFSFSIRCSIVFKSQYSGVAYLFIWLVRPWCAGHIFRATHCVESGRVASAIGCGGGQILRATTVVALSPRAHAVIRGGDLQSAFSSFLPPEPIFSFPPPPEGRHTPSILSIPASPNSSQHHHGSHSVSGRHLFRHVMITGRWRRLPLSVASSY